VSSIGLFLALVVPSGGSWEPIPLISTEQRQAGFRGGEGAQWPRGLTASLSEPDFLVLSIDVAGLYRSFDAGKTWSLCSVGHTARGSAGAAIDPRNAERILSVGANSSANPHNGLYLSTDRGASWKSVLAANISGLNEIRTQIAYDPASYDASTRRTRTVFWSRIRNDQSHYGTAVSEPALYRSDDGGETWRKIPGSEPLGGAWLAHHPTKANHLYAGTADGLHLSTDGGNRFRRVLEGEVTGLDVSPARPNSVWVAQPKALKVSHDGGSTWSDLGTTPPRPGEDAFRGMKVSPASSTRLLVWRESIPNTWSWPRFVSHDGGASWAEARKVSEGAFLPDNTRQGIFAWHSKDPNLAYSIGGDWPTKSTDGGKSFAYAGQGVNAVLVGGKFAFSHVNPDVMGFGSQDYNAAMTRDGGRTWKYLNPSGNGWGGFCYGGFAVDERTLVVGNANGWGDPRHLRVSRDGGATWTDTGHVMDSIDASNAAADDPKVIFGGNFRSQDGGTTWRAMAGCRGVLVSLPGLLYGANREGDRWSVVRSTDKGRTWSKVVDTPEEIRDIAFHRTGSRLLVVSGDRLYRFEGGELRVIETPPSQLGNHTLRTVAIDPANPNLVYAGGAGNWFASSVGAMRSRDGGTTWEVLTLNVPLRPGVRDGGREPTCMRVHPRTRELWVSTSCYGIWKWVPSQTR
jgi:photosystem II stability/assembly factor-like uncharacterized protein